MLLSLLVAEETTETSEEEIGTGSEAEESGEEERPMGRIRVGTRCNLDSTRPIHTTHCKLNSAQLAYVLTRTPSTARPARALLLASFVRLSGLKTTHLA